MDARADPDFLLEEINRRLMRVEHMLARLLRVKKAETSAIVDELTYDPLPESNVRPETRGKPKRHPTLFVHPQAQAHTAVSTFQVIPDDQ